MALEAVIKDLKEKRAAAFEQAKALLEAAAGEKRDLTAEENQKYTAINADIDSLGKRAEQVEQLLADEKALDETFRKLDETPVEQRRDPRAPGTTASCGSGSAGRTRPPTSTSARPAPWAPRSSGPCPSSPPVPAPTPSRCRSTTSSWRT